MKLLAMLFAILVLSSVIVSAANVTISYSASGSSLCKKFCVYKNQPTYTVGIGSSNSINISDDMSLTAQITDADDEAYIILTSQGTDISSREAFLKEKNFPELVNPSFGFPIIDVFSVLIGLHYNDIYINSAALGQGISSGIYSVVLKNNGTISSGPGAGSTAVVVEVI
jgi:hypothetical protein